MCGILAWAGKDPKNFDKMKFNILGVLNETRGKDSCGVTVDGEIHIGIDSNKLYRDFIANKGFPSPVTNPVVIGHTRASTVGLKNEANAHPFGFGDLNDGYEFVGVHNGTLLNHRDLAVNYDVNLSEKLDVNSALTHRMKIDSELLLECIYKSKSFKVLNEYNGAAALMFTNINEPNVLYCYHGASYLKTYTEDGEFEERPLFYWQEGKNSMYISSQKEGLQAIGGLEKDIEIFPHNRVYKIVDGVLDRTATVVVDREGRYQNEASSPKKKSYTPYKRNNSLSNHRSSCNSRVATNQHQLDVYNETKSKNGDKASNAKHNIYNEKPLFDQKITKEKIIFQNMRYRRNGHLLNGCYIYIKNYGFMFIGANAEEGKETFKSFINKTFTEKNFPLVSESFTDKNHIPLNFENPDSINIIDHIEFMYEGVHIKTLHDYYACLDMENNGRKFDWMALSACSKHPTINISVKKKSFEHQLIYFNNELYTGTISPLGSNKIYDIKRGNCVEIKPSRMVLKKSELSKLKDNKTSKVIPINNADDIKLLENVEKTLIENETNILKDEEKKLLYNTLERIFNKDFQNIPAEIKDLEKFKDNPVALKAIKLLENYTSGISEIIGVEEDN